MAQQHLDLLKLAAGGAAQLRTSPSQVMGSIGVFWLTKVRKLVD
jgi:hypothetical protein